MFRMGLYHRWEWGWGDWDSLITGAAVTSPHRNRRRTKNEITVGGTGMTSPFDCFVAAETVATVDLVCMPDNVTVGGSYRSIGCDRCALRKSEEKRACN